MPPIAKEDLDAIERLLPPALRAMDWRWRLVELEGLVAVMAWRWGQPLEVRAAALADALLVDLGAGRPR